MTSLPPPNLIRLTQEVAIQTRTRHAKCNTYYTAACYVGEHRVGRAVAYNLADLDSRITMLWHDALQYLFRKRKVVRDLPLDQLIQFLALPVNPECVLNLDDLENLVYERKPDDPTH